MKISRFLRPVLLSACALCLPLTACKRAPEWTTETLAALQEVEDTDWESIALPEGSPQRVLALYRETGDPNAADDESGLSILDIACAARHRAFIEALLAAGASVQPHDGFSPLHAVLMSATEATDAEETISLLELLAAHGADLRQHGESAVSLMTCAVGNPELTEDMALYLLDKNAPLGDDKASAAVNVMYFAARAWNTALQRAIDMKAPLRDANRTALHAAAIPEDGTEHAETMQMLLKAGVEVNAVDIEGTTALIHLVSAFGDGVTDDQRECLKLLLRHGASIAEPTVPNEEYGEFSAYDFLASHTELIDELREEGFDIPDLPLVIREDAEHLGGDLRRADLRLSGHPQAAEQLKPHLPLLAKVLTQHLYGDDGEMAAAAFSLLCKGDKALAEQILPHLPLWTDYKEWEMQQEGLPAGVAILALLSEAEDDEPTFLTLPKEGILQAATMLEAHGDAMHAMDMAELLEFVDDAEADIDRLCKDEAHPALQLGAMTAKLHSADLPDAKVGSVENWLGDSYNPACMPPAVMKALRLTSLETFWFGEMDAEERAAIVADIESLGLYAAADVYRKALPDGLTDDELADIMGEAAEHATALELAVAHLILENAGDFRNVKK
ncbi:MAG: ankyrin repeat domain-containing protein [Akkermansia sp.]|nr:ankyrin repeat domain-containing protein [Akkermansia sp.]